jgi:hypothetical protein
MHILALIFLIYVIVKWLRGGYRAQPVQPQRVDIFVHVTTGGPGPGERQEEPVLLDHPVGNVVPLRKALTS